MSADATPTPSSGAIDDTDDSWRSMLDEWARHQWRRLHRGAEPDEWPPPWGPPALVIGGLVLGLALIIGLVLPLLRAVFGFFASAIDGGADWLRDASLARVILDPVRAWLDAHAAGLPVTADTLWWTWATAGVVFFLLGWLFAAVAARIGWVLHGAATVAMVYASTTGPARLTAAGLTVLAWTLLSLGPLRRWRGSSRVHAYLPQLPDLAQVLRRPADQ